MEEARRIAANIAKLPALLGAAEPKGFSLRICNGG